MTAIPFLTPAEAKPFFGVNYAPGITEEGQLTLIISAVCEAIEEHIQRPVVARQLQALSDGGSDKILLKPKVYSITSVVENGVPLTSSDYAVYPDVAYIVRKSGNSAGRWASGVQSVVITYTAGVAQDVASVPENIKLAAKIAIKHFSSFGPLSFGAEYTDRGSIIRADMFPRPALWLLDRYKVVS